MAKDRNTTPKYCRTKLPYAPNFSRMALIEYGTAPLATLAMTPNVNAAAAAPAHQAMSTGSSSRRARPNGVRSPNGRGGTTSREASTPAPASRRDASSVVATTSANTVAPATTSGPASFSVNGRIRSVQPNGVNHRSHRVLGPESAIMRTTKATPNTPMPNPVAKRRERLSCEVSAPTATNTAGAITTLNPYSTVSPGQQGDQRRPAQNHADRGAERRHRRGRGPRCPRAAGEHQLPAARVLLAPEEPGGGEEAPNRADRREEDVALVDGVAADRV